MEQIRNRIFLMLSILGISAMAYAQEYALSQLENSPRHHEWVKVTAGDRQVHCFVAYPEANEKTPGVLVIHENRGLTDWVRSFADQLAAAGYLAIAPDLLSGFSAEFDQTSDFPSSDEARNAIYQLNPDQVTGDLNAVRSYLSGIAACNGKTVVVGFCWGGSNSFRFATNNKEIEAACVFYGGSPDSTAIQRIQVPVYGFYGENDQRINSQIPGTEDLMNTAGKEYDYVIYEGAGHAYMRRGDDPESDEASKMARDESWKRLLAILEKI